MLPIAQAYQTLKVSYFISLSQLCCDPELPGCLDVAAFVFVFQEKVTKEVNFILANQETIQSQITQLEDTIKQMEVNYLCSVLTFSDFIKPDCIFLCDVNVSLSNSACRYLLFK